VGGGGGGDTFGHRFSREAKAMAKLSHPHIVMVHDFGRTESGLFYFIMEYVDGLNLRQLIADHRIEPKEALAIIPQICEALQFAHDEGVVHRDIKPENILIDKKGRVKIADFGLAKLVSTAPDDLSLTREGGTMGTPMYMAPEQLEGAKHVDHRADIYSLGVVFYELLTGELPLGRFAAPSEKVQIDVRLDEIVLRTLEKEPDRRYQHVSEIKTQVDEIRGITPEVAHRLRHALGRDYKSKATLFGWPLVHITSGVDPTTGRRRVAKGIFAMGDQAIGVFAVGGVATGVVAYGGIAFGLITMGGLAFGLLTAVGGLAIGGTAFGGVAIGGVAIGGAAIGVYCAGGWAWGLHAVGAAGGDAEAQAFFSGWGHNWPTWMAIVGMGAPAFWGVSAMITWVALRSKSATSGWEDSSADDEPPPSTPHRAVSRSFWKVVVTLTILVIATIAAPLFWPKTPKPIFYPGFGDTGFVVSADGPKLGDDKARQLSIPEIGRAHV